jgi:hypothetical protein
LRQSHHYQASSASNQGHHFTHRKYRKPAILQHTDTGHSSLTTSFLILRRVPATTHSKADGCHILPLRTTELFHQLFLPSKHHHRNKALSHCEAIHYHGSRQLVIQISGEIHLPEVSQLNTNLELRLRLEVSFWEQSAFASQSPYKRL